MQPILRQSEQFPERVAAVRRAIGQVPLAERFQDRSTFTPPEPKRRVHSRLTDEEHRQLRHALDLAASITGSVT